MLQIKIDKKASAKFLKLMKQAPQKADKAFKMGLRRCGDQLHRDAAKGAPYKTGNLKRSITSELHGSEKVVVGTNLVYARIHDEGGVIFPKKSKYLTFKIGGRWVRVKKVVIKKYKGKGYLTPAFEKLARGDAEKIFNEEFEKAIS